MNQLKIQIPSLIENIRVVESFIDNSKEKFNIEDDIYGNIMVAVTESVNNAIRHGNKFDKDKNVQLSLFVDDDRLRFEIEDEGAGFDYNSLSDPTAPENLENPGGRGIFLMRNLSDDVEFQKEGRKVQLTFLFIMPDLPIEFETEDIDFDLPNQEDLSNWLNLIIDEHKFELASLTYIFCSDDYLHQINLEYLNHDTLTDIITFNNADIPGIIESDIFISIDRVKENAQLLNQSFTNELHRVMAHGVLHLLGYDDKTAVSKQIMSKKEDYCLSLRSF